MSALKKIFGAGDSRDDEVMYQTEGQGASVGQSGASGGSTATENVDREIQSSRDIGTGAQDNPGFVSKATDTSNVQSQFADTSSGDPSATYARDSNTSAPTTYGGDSSAPTTYTRDSNTSAPTTYGGDSNTSAPTTYGGESNTGRNTAIAGVIAGAGTAGAAGTGAMVYASDRTEGDSRQDDISQATYTERSYPLASESTSKPTAADSSVAQYPTGYSSDPSAAGVVGGTGAVTSESSEAQYPTGYSRDANAPGAVGGTTGDMPGSFPGEEKLDPVSNTGVTSTSTDSSYGRDAGIAGGATAATGAAGYGAYSASDTRGTETSLDPVSNPNATSTSTDSSYGKDAAIAGGMTTAAGAAGYGAYSASDTRGTDSQRTTTDTRHDTGIASIIDPRAQGTDERKVNETHYGRDAAAAGAVTGVGAGAGYAATRDDNDAYKTSGTDERNIQESETHYGRDTAAAGAVAGVGAGAGYTVASSEDNRVHTDTSGHNYLHKKSVEEPGEKKQGFFSKAFHGPRKDEEVAIGDSNPSNEIQRSGESTSMGSSSIDPTAGLPHDDSGLITLQKEGSDPTAPALVIREKPGGGIETVPDTR